MIEIEAETANLERLPSPFMLPGVDSRIQLLQHLIVAREEGAIEDFRVAKLNFRVERLRRDHDALMLQRYLGQLEVENFDLPCEREGLFRGHQAGSCGAEPILAIR